MGLAESVFIIRNDSSMVTGWLKLLKEQVNWIYISNQVYPSS